jgi:hypothetical protein
MATLVSTDSTRRNGSVALASGSSLTDADFWGCRWIEGAPKPLRPGMFCGRPVAEGESWCPQHRRAVFGDGDTGW